MPTQWAIDYCLTCDREAPQGAAYCSQSCRMADMEPASCSSSPKTTASTSSSTAPGGFYLPPAYNFSSHKSSTSSSSSTRSPAKAAPSWYPSNHSPPRKSSGSGLHTSHSRTSLSSMPSQYSSYETAYLSEKALRELNEYASCFDQVRDNRRRMTVV